MAEINTTNINDLPTDPANGGSINGNINIITNETVGLNNSSMPTQTITTPASGLSLDQSTISQIVNGLQQASLAGATSLPSRDIPLTTTQLTKDPYTQVNYVPEPTTRDYISDDTEDIEKYYKQEKINNSIESIYDEIQAPLLLAILYFLFQLPFFKKNIYKYFPFLCHSDGNYNINGLLFTCALFGFVYYTLSKSVKNFSKF
jgi:hypothetical protein